MGGLAVISRSDNYTPAGVDKHATEFFFYLRRADNVGPCEALQF